MEEVGAVVAVEPNSFPPALLGVRDEVVPVLDVLPNKPPPVDTLVCGAVAATPVPPKREGKPEVLLPVANEGAVEPGKLELVVPNKPPPEGVAEGFAAVLPKRLDPAVVPAGFPNKLLPAVEAG